MVAWALRLGVITSALAVIASGCCERDDPGIPEVAPAARPAARANAEVALDLVDGVAECAVFHRGALLDLGSDAVYGRYGYDLRSSPDIEDVNREGATWAQINGRTIGLAFFQRQASPAFVEARIRGGEARSVSVRIDGQHVGSMRLNRGRTEVLRTAVTADNIERGLHEVTFQFHGGKREQAKALIDWIRVGEPDNLPIIYSPPTMRDLVIDAVIAKQPRKALAMHAPAVVRCPIGVRKGMTVRALVGYTGPGEGEAEVRVVESGKPPYVLQTEKVGGEDQRHAVVEASLDSFVGKIVSLELAATSSAHGGRVLFGDPLVDIESSQAPDRKKAQAVVIVVLSSTNREQLPPYHDVPAMATLTDLAASSATFWRHRTTTSVAAGSMASMLTGFAPTVHQVTDSGARLPERVPILSSVVRDGRATTAMFTGNPSTSAAFGFNRGWDEYRSFSPVSGVSARAPLREAIVWLEHAVKDGAETPLFLVVHARGGHPPWAATAEEIHSLPPEEYTGPVDARRGAQVLANARNHKRRIRLKEADRVRIGGFSSLALVAEDQLLNQLMEVLRKADRWKSTLLVVTSDVGMGNGSRVPFGDAETMGEDVLELPLIVHFPDDQFAGKHVHASTGPMDIARTVLGALQLELPHALDGSDLFQVAANPEHFLLRMQHASLANSYATRWGDLLLSGASPRAPSLCNLALNDGCTADLHDDFPFLAAFMWRKTYRQVRAPQQLLRPAPMREPATLDPDMVAALAVWGNQEAR